MRSSGKSRPRGCGVKTPETDRLLGVHPQPLQALAPAHVTPGSEGESLAEARYLYVEIDVKPFKDVRRSIRPESLVPGSLRTPASWARSEDASSCRIA